MRDEDVRRFRKQMRLLARRLRQELHPVHGLARTELHVLIAVSRLGAVTPREVGDELRMASSNVAAALRELDAAGLVVRERDHEDGRRVNVSLTERGTEVVAAFRGEQDTWLGKAIATQLTPEEFQVLQHAGELMERLSQFEVQEQLRGDA